MAKLNFPCNLHMPWIFGVYDFRLHIQYRKNFLSGRKRGLQCPKLLCQLLNRLKKRADIIDKHKQCSQGNSACQHRRAPLPNYDNHRNDRQHVNGRAENGKRHNLTPVCLEKLPALPLKFLILFFFPCKYLNQLHAGNMLRQKGIQLRDARSRNPVRLSGHITEKESQRCHERNQNK